MKTGFIGAGKVGFSLGKYLSVNGVELSGYYSRSLSSAMEAAEFTGSTPFNTPRELCMHSDILVLSVPDKELNGVYNELASEDLNGKLLCHCSGAMSAEEVFPDAKNHGALRCSVHPLFPVSSRYGAYKELGGAYFCIEGDPEGTQLWRDILTALGNPARVIDSSVKSRYHAACSVISNLVCALADESLSLMRSCGFSDAEALAALRPLAESNLRCIFDTDPTSALTGPIERNDIGTVRRHLDCIPEGSGKDTYISASLRLCEMAQRRHSDRDYSGLKEMLYKAKK